jgi:hypothetical protein
VSDPAPENVPENAPANDEVAQLRARLGGDPLDEKRIKCAAFLGHEPATKALDIALTPEWELRDTDIWITRLKPLGKEAFVRTVIAIQRATGDVKGLDVAEAWVLCPCEDHRKAAEASSSGLAAKAASRTVAAAAQQDVYQALRNLDPATTPRIVAAALVPWLLERGDPLRTGAAAAPAPTAEDLSAEQTAALDMVVAKLKKDPVTLVRELAKRLSPDERADLSRRILERRTFDN